MATLLQLVQQATAELGIPVPATVAGNSTQDVVQMLALMNATGYELLRRHSWQPLQKRNLIATLYTETTGTWTEGSAVVTGIPSTTGLDTSYMVVAGAFTQATTIQSVDSATQVTLTQSANAAGSAADIIFAKFAYDLPSDYDSIIPRTMWDLDKHWELLGPESPQQWEWLLSGFIATGPRIRWRLLNNKFCIWPPSTTNAYLGYEYRSKGWALAADGTVKNSLTVDTDTCIYPDRLMVLSAKLKYFEGKGFDTTAIYRDYMQELEAAMAQDQSAGNISFAPQRAGVLISWNNIPDSGFGR